MFFCYCVLPCVPLQQMSKSHWLKIYSLYSMIISHGKKYWKLSMMLCSTTKQCSRICKLTFKCKYRVYMGLQASSWTISNKNELTHFIRNTMLELVLFISYKKWATKIIVDRKYFTNLHNSTQSTDMRVLLKNSHNDNYYPRYWANLIPLFSEESNA